MYALWLGLPGSIKDVLDAVLLRPCHKFPATELRPVVSPDSLGVAPKCGCSVQQAGSVMPANAKVGCDVHALVREVVSDCQALDTPGDGSWPGDRIAHKVHAFQVWLTARAAIGGTRAHLCAWSSCAF